MSTLLRRLFAGLMPAAAFVAIVLGCSGDSSDDSGTLVATRPAAPERYAVGQLGFVKPTFARRYLVQAYRVMNGLPAVRSGAYPQPYDAGLPGDLFDRWRALLDRVLGPAPAGDRSRTPETERHGSDYSWFLNCGTSTYESAERTLNARIATYGIGNRAVADWTRAQLVVLQNCDGSDLQLPENAPSWADAALRADRAYQIASAYFYGTHYADAITRFRAIGDDASSPWKPYGHYLAARALIRQATVPDEPESRPVRLAEADAELAAVLRDPSARELHRSAQGLRDFIAVRLRPAERLHEVSALLTKSPAPSEQAFIDFRVLMDGVIGDTDTFEYQEVAERAALREDDDLVDWILALQGSGPEARARIVDRWRRTQSLPWLVAALWRSDPSSPEATEVLRASERVATNSPGYFTVSVLRARLLIQRGDRRAARALLATLPSADSAGVDRDVVNVLRALRVATADTMRELLDNSPRWYIDPEFQLDEPVLGEDAALIMDRTLPLERLVEAATSAQLSEPLRTQVALTAFSRAIVLNRTAAARQVAGALRTLVPVLRPDLDAYLAATTDDARHRRAILLLLRTPSMSATISGGVVLIERLETSTTTTKMRPEYFQDGPWWCPAADVPHDGVLEFLFGTRPVQSPAFLSSAERAAATTERASLMAAGQGREYLASEALRWAQAAPRDPQAAEALARAVHGWRRSHCAESARPKLPQQAFSTLHRLFPKSEWTAVTKYWWED